MTTRPAVRSRRIERNKLATFLGSQELIRAFEAIAEDVSGTLPDAIGGLTHNTLSGLQGGSVDEYYHLTQTEYIGTGTGPFARQTSPTFVTPTLGVASATSLTLSTPLTVPNGGLGIASGASGGIPYFSSAISIASSATLAQNQIVLGGGAGAAPGSLGSLGTTTTVLHGNATGAPTFGAVSLTADVSGTLPAANGGTGQSSYTVGDILYASAATMLSRLAGVATGNALISGGVATAPSWGKVDLTAHISGNLPVTNLNSGTSATSATFWRGDGSWSAALVGPMTANRFIPDGSTVPTNGLYLPASNTLGFATNSALAVVIESNGRIGIGTSAPGGLLHSVSNASSGHFFDTYNSTATALASVQVRRARGTFASPSAISSGDSLGGFVFSGATSSTTFDNTAGIFATASENFSSTNAGSAMTFATTAIGSTTRTTRMTLSDVGDLGIGLTPSGTYKLEVNGALSISSATMIRTATSFTNGAGASVGTLNNAPAAGDPTKWIPVNDNGTTRYIPAW